MENKNRRGELTTNQLVMIIVLIVSFVVILFLIFRLNLGETTDKEICHNSVVLINKATSFVGSLDCKTNYLCISGGGDCEGTISETIRVNPENKEEIMKAIAEEMSDCWWQFGEGKMNYGTSQGTSIKYAICSIIEFDSHIQEKIPVITRSEFYDYLEKTKKDNSQSYLKYLYEVSDVWAVPIPSQIKLYPEDKIRTNERYSIITGLDDNFVFSDNILKVYIIPTAETSSRLVQGEFLTKV